MEHKPLNDLHDQIAFYELTITKRLDLVEGVASNYYNCMPLMKLTTDIDRARFTRKSASILHSQCQALIVECTIILNQLDDN